MANHDHDHGPKTLDRRHFLGAMGAMLATASSACNRRGADAGPTPPEPTPEPSPVTTRELRPVSGGRILILGGTKFLGPAIVRSATERGHTVTLFNRGKTNPDLFPELEKRRGDRRKSDFDALKTGTWDAVIDTSGYLPRTVTEVAKLLEGRVDQYVFISSISVYADTGLVGIDESGALAQLEKPLAGETPKDIMENYGALKAQCEQAAEAVFRGRTTNIRPGLIVGPDDPTDRFTYWPVRVARGGEVLAPGVATDPVQVVDVRDLGEWIVKAVEQRALGAFNAAGPRDTMTIGDLLAACQQASGSDARFTWANKDFLEKNEVMPWMHMPVWVPPGSEFAGLGAVNNTKAVTAGLTFRPIADTCKDTLAWWNTLDEERRKVLLEGKSAGISAARETEVLTAWHKRETGAGDTAKKTAGLYLPRRALWTPRPRRAMPAPLFA